MLDLDKLCREASQRVVERINRSAGQQKRQMMTGWRKKQIENLKGQHEKTKQN